MIDIMGKVDLTLLKATATFDDIKILCNEAKKYNAYSVCVPPVYVKRAVEYLKGEIPVCTVIGFPLGYQNTDVKIFETERALKDGAVEIDMVINITDLKNKNYENIEREIKGIKNTVGNKVLKVIIETCYLDEEEMVEICKVINSSGADFVKTSTGFGTSGAKLGDIKILKSNIDEGVKIKASGGIRDAKFARELIEAGVSRIGSSSVLL